MKYTTAVFPKYGEPIGDGGRQNRKDYLQPMAERFDSNPPTWPMVPEEIEAMRVRLVRLVRLVVWMNVERSVRWAPRKNDAGKVVATYCDHYTWDFLQQLLDAYPPLAALLWWSGANEAAALSGESVPVVYPREGVTGTVVEYGATSLARWLGESAEDFGWVRFDTAEDLQAYLDEHAVVGIVCAEKKPSSKGASHITVALPSITAKALKFETDDTGILQTEAGGRNRRLTRRTWYTDYNWHKVHYLALPQTTEAEDDTES